MRRKSTFNQNSNKRAKKERTIMIVSSVFVLAALTLTGVYVKSNSEKQKNDGYNIDFSVLESEAENNAVHDKYEEIKSKVEESLSKTEDDLDYTPMEQVDSGIVKIPGLTDDEPVPGNVQKELTIPQNREQTLLEEAEQLDQAAISADSKKETTPKQVQQKTLNYQSGDTLVWPVSGNVLIPYSMDNTVYFSTLEQYKCNPALIIAATEGDSISASAAGKVTDVFYNEEIGSAVTVEIGNGYVVTYGQLKDIAVSKGDYLDKGSIVGYVAAPTKYYSVEGTNVYFALTLDGVPVDPMGELQ
ncbi:MAG TPA: M23 family metallopeptidase [Lachnospiraceae bacterium]|nr:M23 family metallopeptidase [Lachnospiraceae bacterium]